MFAKFKHWCIKLTANVSKVHNRNLQSIYIYRILQWIYWLYWDQWRRRGKTNQHKISVWARKLLSGFFYPIILVFYSPFSIYMRAVDWICSDHFESTTSDPNTDNWVWTKAGRFNQRMSRMNVNTQFLGLSVLFGGFIRPDGPSSPQLSATLERSSPRQKQTKQLLTGWLPICHRNDGFHLATKEITSRMNRNPTERVQMCSRREKS